jgi:hypothetical protein
MVSDFLQLTPLPGRTDLFYPDLEQNISKILPTALTLFGKKYPKNKVLLNSLNEKIGWQKIKESEITNIVFIVLDSLGLKQFNEYSQLMKAKFETNGLALSSVFPTITSTCIASLRFGEMPKVHGIVGQKIKFTEIDNIVDTLTLRTKTGNIDLHRAGVNVKNWVWCDFPMGNDPTISYTSLIESHIANSGLSHLVYKKPCSIGYASHIDSFAAAKRVLETPTSARRFLDIYIGSIDSITHRYTTESQVLKEEVENIEFLLFKMLKRLNPKIAKQTAVIITADHGQENLTQEKTVTVTSEEEEELTALLKSRGRSGRVIHLYSKEGKHDELADWFVNKIGDKGVIITPKEYHKFMGKGANTQKIIERIGDVQVVLGENASIYFGHSGNYDPIFNLGLNATHGSLSKDELLVPLIVARVDDLLG